MDKPTALIEETSTLSILDKAALAADVCIITATAGTAVFALGKLAYDGIKLGVTSVKDKRAQKVTLPDS